MNEFERRKLDIAQRQHDLALVLKAMGRNVLAEHFGYTVKFVQPITVDAQLTKYVAMQSDAFFVLHYISSCVILDGSPYYETDSGSIEIQITDTGSGQDLYSVPSSAGVLTATINRPQSGIPFLLPVPHIIPPNTNVKIDVTQFADTGTTFDEINIALMGSRVVIH